MRPRVLATPSRRRASEALHARPEGFMKALVKVGP